MRRRILLLTIALLLVATGAYAAFSLLHAVSGTTTTVLTLTNLGNTARSSAGATFDNRQGQTGGGYQRAKIECNLTFAAAPTATGSLDLWALQTVDGGTTFENTTTGRMPNVSCAPTPSQAGTRVIYEIPLPAERMQWIAVNNATGQNITTGTIKVLPITTQGQ